MHPMLTIALRAATKAGKIIAQNIDQLDRVEVKQKGPNNYVTDIDLAAEAVIVETILSSYPDHSILSEECGLKENTDPDYLWIVDPLDGTTNFVHGYPVVAVSIAIQHEGVIKHALIYNPISQDVYMASKGRGSTLNQQRIRISQHKSLNGALITPGMPNAQSYKSSFYDVFSDIQIQCAGMRRSGSSVMDLAYVASGATDLLWKAQSKIWDVAAASLLIKEAGGMITDIYGGTGYLEEKGMIAGNPDMIKKIIPKLQPHLQKS